MSAKKSRSAKKNRSTKQAKVPSVRWNMTPDQIRLEEEGILAIAGYVREAQITNAIFAANRAINPLSLFGTGLKEAKLLHESRDEGSLYQSRSRKGLGLGSSFQISSHAQAMEALRSLESAASANEFEEVWKKAASHLSGPAKFVLVMFLLPSIVSIYANLATPTIERFLFGGNVPTDSQTIAPNLRFVNRNSVNVRVEPSSSSKTITRLSQGQVVVAIETKNDWTLVTLKEGAAGAETKGWVYSKFLSGFIGAK